VKLVFREADLRLATTTEPAQPAAKAALYGA